jgi:hypothetical protein
MAHRNSAPGQQNFSTIGVAHWSRCLVQKHFPTRRRRRLTWRFVRQALEWATATGPASVSSQQPVGWAMSSGPLSAAGVRLLGYRHRRLGSTVYVRGYPSSVEHRLRSLARPLHHQGIGRKQVLVRSNLAREVMIRLIWLQVVHVHRMSPRRSHAVMDTASLTTFVYPLLWFFGAGSVFAVAVGQRDHQHPRTLA